MNILGISAKKQGGKSTLIDYFEEAIPCCKVIRFADALKQIVLDCFVPQKFGWNHPDDLDLDEVKNTELPCGKTVRQLLQTVGTDWFRSAWPDCWVNAYRKTLVNAKGAALILTPDVRFPNELKMVQSLGGKVIRLLRSPLEFDPHESETALDSTEEEALKYLSIYSPKFGETLNTAIFTDFGPKDIGKYFDILYDNRDQTLEDSYVWADHLIRKCFSWNTEMGDISNFSIDLTKYSSGEYYEF